LAERIDLEAQRQRLAMDLSPHMHDMSHHTYSWRARDEIIALITELEQTRAANDSLVASWHQREAEMIQLRTKLATAEERAEKADLEISALDDELDRWAAMGIEDDFIKSELRTDRDTLTTQLTTERERKSELATLWHERYEKSQETIDEYQRRLDTERERAEKAEVQLVGCLTAAEGVTAQPAQPGDYGWSLAYQRVLELWLSRDAALTDTNTALSQLTTAEERAEKAEKQICSDDGCDWLKDAKADHDDLAARLAEVERERGIASHNEKVALDCANVAAERVEAAESQLAECLKTRDMGWEAAKRHKEELELERQANDLLGPLLADSQAKVERLEGLIRDWTYWRDGCADRDVTTAPERALRAALTDTATKETGTC
jgi:hypothetical protein